MSTITETVGCLLSCKQCGRKIFVGNTMEYRSFTIYYHAETRMTCGMSLGDGGTFRCRDCIMSPADHKPSPTGDCRHAPVGGAPEHGEDA